jgi:small subunit ribosomal protein S20
MGNTMAKEEAAKTKVRRPSALKRDIQAQKRNLANKSLRASVNTAIRTFNEKVALKDAPNLQDQLNKVFSLIDKGVKNGIFKKNTAARKKGNLAKKLVTPSM